MTSHQTDLYAVAARLDESPTEMLNGGATDALGALAASAPEAEAVASSRGVEQATVKALWERADTRLRDLPGPDELFAAAADAATLLYAAAWMLDSECATTDELEALM